MSDFKSTEECLREFYTNDRYTQLKEDAALLLRTGSLLTLRQDIILHPEKYTFHPSTKIVPEAVQMLYSDIILYGIAVERGWSPRTRLTVDNIFVKGTRYLITAIPTPEDLTTVEIICHFSEMLHPAGNEYPEVFNNFIELLSAAHSSDQLEIVYNHPAMLSFNEKGMLAYKAYAQMQERAKSDAQLWSNFGKTMGPVAILNSIQGEFYKKIYNYPNMVQFYNNNQTSRGILVYYKNIVQHVCKEIEKENAAQAESHKILKRQVMETAIEEASNNRIDEQEAVQKEQPTCPSVQRYCIAQIAEDMEIFFPQFLIYLYVFMIEENIDLSTRKLDCTFPQAPPKQLSMPPQTHPAQSQFPQTPPSQSQFQRPAQSQLQHPAQSQFQHPAQ